MSSVALARKYFWLEYVCVLALMMLVF